MDGGDERGGGQNLDLRWLRRRRAAECISDDVLRPWDVNEIRGILSYKRKVALLALRNRRGGPGDGGDERLVVRPEGELPGF